MSTNTLTPQMNSLKTESLRMSLRRYPRGIRFAIVASIVLSTAFSVQIFAQEVEADQASLARSYAPSALGNNAPGIVDGHAVSTPNDSDLGEQQILKREEGYQPWTISAGVPFYWTSNVALTKSGERDDFIVAPAASVFYEPRITPTFYGLVGVREQLFYYDNFDSFDFGSFDFEIGFRYVLPNWHNLQLRFEYDYNRLTKKDSFDDFFSSQNLLGNAEVPFRFGRAQLVSVGTSVSISTMAWPEAPRRNDYEFYVGYTANLSRAFSINASGRIALRDYYHQDSRFDVSEILAAGANYRFNKYLSAGAIGTFAASQSNHSVFDYEVANLGGVVSLWWKF